jgi:CheY-like chemotaxis protein/anti-sigma regulatory factor (Ser/Thr protein kinase)
LNAGHQSPAAHEELEQEICDAREAAERVRTVVQDLRVVSRKDDDERRVVDIEQVLDSALRMAGNAIRHRARLTKAYGDVPQVLAHESRLGQVFLNLLVNAAQAIADGNADANEIVVRTSTLEGGRVVVEISDTGAGMTPEVQKKLFTPFFSTKPAAVGTGLGLTICRRLLAAMDGEISVQSAVGQGSVFRVTLMPAPGEERVTCEPSPPVSTPRRGRILIVDDDEMVGKVLQRLFKPEHDVTAFASAEVALERLIAGERFDVILCDLMMPIVTGMDLYEKLSAVVPDQAARIVFMTGGAFTPRSRAFLSEVTNLRVEKPFDSQRLRGLVNERLQ